MEEPNRLRRHFLVAAGAALASTGLGISLTEWADRNLPQSPVEAESAQRYTSSEGRILDLIEDP